MSYKNYLAVTGIRTKPEEPSSAEKFETLDNEAGSDVFKDTTSVYREVDQALGTPVRKVLATVDFSDEAKLKAFQEKFLSTESGKFAAYPTQRLGDFFSADIINVVRRMQDPTGNQFTIPIPANLKDKFAEIFQGCITNKPASYKGTPGLFRFELDFDNGSPSYNQVLQLRTFMTLMENEYSTMTGTKVITGKITADDIAREFGPDMATLYDFALEYTEKVFNSKVMLSEEAPNVGGKILNAYLHARQGVAIDQPLNADGFFTRAMDGREIQEDFLGVYDDYIESKTYLDYIQEDQASLNYHPFARALGLNKRSEPLEWQDEVGTPLSEFFNALTTDEKNDLQTVLNDFNNTVEFSIPINNADGTQVATIQAQCIFEPIPAGFRLVTTNFTTVDGTILDDRANIQLASMQSSAETYFSQYLKARGY